MKKSEYENKRIETHLKMCNEIPRICNDCNLPDIIINLEAFKLHYLKKLKNISETIYNETLEKLSEAQKNQHYFDEMMDDLVKTKVEVSLFKNDDKVKK